MDTAERQGAEETASVPYWLGRLPTRVRSDIIQPGRPGYQSDDRNLTPVWRFNEKVAEERYAAGCGIAEVETAFNVLEEAIWHVVVPRLPAEDLAEATGLVGTVLGSGKDVLARKSVSLATSHVYPRSTFLSCFEGTHSKMDRDTAR